MGQVLSYQEAAENDDRRGGAMSLKRPKVVAERKVWFLGRFLSRTLSSSTLARLHSHLRFAKGVKTRLKLSLEGLSSGSKGSTILRSKKLPYEFTPLEDIEDLLEEGRFGNVLLCVIRLGGDQYEILAYRYVHSVMRGGGGL